MVTDEGRSQELSPDALNWAERCEFLKDFFCLI
jgi:hypothetical protein